jgi:hypothetical protein
LVNCSNVAPDSSAAWPIAVKLSVVTPSARAALVAWSALSATSFVNCTNRRTDNAATMPPMAPCRPKKPPVTERSEPIALLAKLRRLDPNARSGPVP